MADLPRYGRGMCEEITLSPEQPSVEGLHLFVNQEGRVRLNHENVAIDPTILSVYPNPAEDRIVVCGLKANAEYRVMIQNSLGMTVCPEWQVRSNLLGECMISVTDLPMGIYFIQVNTDSGCMKAKFVKR
jgi:hypothetical protein